MEQQQLPQQRASLIQQISLFKQEKYSTVYASEVDRLFASLKKDASELSVTASQAVIDTQSDRDTSASTVLRLKSTLKSVEEIHKQTKEPLSVFVSIIDSKKREIVDVIKNSIDILGTKVTNFDNVQRALETQRLNKLKEEQEKVSKLILKEAKELERMTSNVIARIYGGIQNVEQNGQRVERTVPAIASLEELISYQNRVLSAIPPSTNYRSENLNIYSLTIKTINKTFEDRKKAFMTNSQDIISEKEMSNLADAGSIASTAEQNLNKAARQTDAKLKNVNKNQRREIVFDVIDISKIPIQFLQINEQAIRSFFVENREKILENLSKGGDGHEFIPGIKVGVESTTLIR